jgi:hypothetical protein
MKPVMKAKNWIYQVDAVETEKYWAEFPTLRDTKFALYLQLHGRLTKSEIPNDDN